MKTSNRTVIVAIALPVALLFAVAAPAQASDGCKQETHKIAVYPKGGNPKLVQIPRYETRDVTVCNGKVVSSQPQRNASSAEMR